MRSVLVFSLLLAMKALSRIFYRHDFSWVGETTANPWQSIRLVVFLNHTSLFEPLFVGAVPSSFLWRLARHGVVPAADKTINRPFVGMIFRFVAHQVVSITRERDQTWVAVLQKIDPDSMVVIAPEGRMMRANGLDSKGQPMTVRGGVSDILEAIQQGRMLLAYSGGLHHVQIPGDAIPKIFKTLRLRLEVLEIARYVEGLERERGAVDLRRAIRDDLERRRDLYCPRS